MANSKPGEHVLIVLPVVEKRPRRVLERVAAQLREKGHEVTLLSTAEFGQAVGEATPATPIQPRLL